MLFIFYLYFLLLINVKIAIFDDISNCINKI